MSPGEHLIASAERELGAFMRAVSEMFGLSMRDGRRMTGWTSLSGWIRCLR